MRSLQICKPVRAWGVVLTIAAGVLGVMSSGGPRAAIATFSLPALPTVGGTNPVETAGLLFEVWTNIAGASVADLVDNPRFQTNAPDLRALASAADTRTVFTNNTQESYGGRLSGFLVPKESASYELFLRSAKASQLFLSPDEGAANLALIAEEQECCNPFEESGALQTSAPLSLVAGKRYALEVLWKADTGTNYAQLAWRKLGDQTLAEDLQPIPGEFLATVWDPNAGPPFATGRLAGRSVGFGGTATLTLNALGEQPLFYQWSRIGTNILGATNSSITITNFAMTNVGIYTITVTNAVGGLAASAGLFPKGSLFVEAEDFNFGAGNYVTNKPIGMTGAYVGDAYRGLGTAQDEGVDYHANGVGAQPFRPNTGAEAGDENQQPDWLPRGDYDVRFNNILLSNEPGEWYNYTRLFPTPAQDYQVLARIASTASPIRVQMDEVTAGASTTNQVLRKLGEFSPVRGTAGSNSFEFFPLVDELGQPAFLKAWSGEKTFRITVSTNTGSLTNGVASTNSVTLTNATVDLDYFVFVPPSSESATNSFTSITRDGNNLILTWTGGILESGPDVNGPWTPVPNASSPFTISITGQRKFYRLK